MLTFGIDWDDVISDLNARAIELANRDFNLNLTLEDINNWENTGRASVIKHYYQKQELYDAQYVTDEAKQFVQQLQTIGDVYICTAIAPEFMGTRVRQIKKAFPYFPDDHIIMGAQKSLLQFDFTLDDGAHNVLQSMSNYPVLFRRPWNHEITGVLSVNSYADFFQLIKQIISSMLSERTLPNRPAVIALVGPSGSGKSAVLKEFLQDPEYKKPQSFSTNSSCSSNHIFITKSEFKKLQDEFLETTMYAGHAYGTLKSHIDLLMKAKKYLILPLDICGAITMKRHYPTLIVYCKSRKEHIIERILDKPISNHEKKLRLLTLEKEMNNERLCDYVLDAENLNDIRLLRETLKQL